MLRWASWTNSRMRRKCWPSNEVDSGSVISDLKFAFLRSFSGDGKSH